jgi:hypothetical protein
VRAILGDVNIQGQVRVLTRILENETWHDLWFYLNLPILTFRDLSLTRRVADAVLWEVCQKEQVILLTANRNADGPDSLEATIRARNTANSLPVFTVGDGDKILHSRVYAERIVESLLEYLLYIDKYRGTGRLYLP